MEDSDRRPREPREVTHALNSAAETASALRSDTPPAPKVTTSPSAVPPAFLGEHAGHGGLMSSAPDAPVADLVPFDAWTRDRLHRSSFPPVIANRTASGRPAAPHTPRPPASDVPDDGSVLSLVERSPVLPPFAGDLCSEMSDRFALGDFSGAMRAAELLLGQDPSHELAQHYQRASRTKLEAIYTSRLLARGAVPELAMAQSELRWLGLEPQIGMVLSQIDGRSGLEAVIAGSGVPRLDALRALVELLDGRVIRLV